MTIQNPLRLARFTVLMSIVLYGTRALPQTINVSELSLRSLELKILHDDTPIGIATGFVVAKGIRHYLITNRHVVLACGQDQAPTDVGGWLCANKVMIYHNRLNHLGQWTWVTEDLFDDKHDKRWLEH